MNMTIQKYIHDICQHSGLDAENVQIELNDDDAYLKVEVTVPAEDSGLFIGFRGETLSSLQRLVRVLFQDEYPEKKIIVNVNNYREQRTEKLQEMATNIAERVLESGRPYVFAYLPPHERYVIHSLISEDEAFQELESISEGEGAQRRLVIRLKSSADQA